MEGQKNKQIVVTPNNSQIGFSLMVQMLYILFGMVIILFALAIILTILPDRKKKEDKKPIDKTPVKIELQLEHEDYLYTLYNDGTWEVDYIY